MSSLPAKTSTSLLECTSSETWKSEILKAIPKEIALEAMMRVARSVASDAKFSACDPRSFLIALLKCGRAGLYPDGREAHLIPFGKEVQAIFDWKGLVALANRAGYLVTPKLVFSNDDFMVEEDDGTGKTKITHRVDYRKPRGELQAAYSRAVRPDGQVDYEVMTSEEVEQVRQHYSRAKDSTPWKNSYGEMMKKTVIKRHSKRWDMSPEIRAAINADDDSAPSIGQPRITTPIFPPKTPVLEVQASIPTQPSPQFLLSEQCKKDGISETDLLNYLDATFGLSVNSIGELGDESVGMIEEKWDEIVKDIRNAAEKGQI